MFYIPYFSLHHQYKLSEFLGFCKTPKNVGYIFSASGGSQAGKGTCPKDKLVFFRALLLFPLFYAEKGFVMIRKLFKLSYLTARAPAKSHVQFGLCLRKNKQYNGSDVQFHDCQVSSSITQRHRIFYFNVRTD